MSAIGKEEQRNNEAGILHLTDIQCKSRQVSKSGEIAGGVVAARTPRRVSGPAPIPALACVWVGRGRASVSRRKLPPKTSRRSTAPSLVAFATRQAAPRQRCVCQARGAGNGRGTSEGAETSGGPRPV